MPGAPGSSRCAAQYSVMARITSAWARRERTALEIAWPAAYGSKPTPAIVPSCASRLIFGASYSPGGVTHGGSSKMSANGRMASMFTRKSGCGAGMTSVGAGF